MHVENRSDSIAAPEADRDHREIGRRLELFHQDEECPGAIFWHPRGAILYELLESFIRRRMRAAGYQEVRSPSLLPRELWERSGHWDKFGANMFVLRAGEDGRELALKPMSCPGHILIFKSRNRSWRELPLRMREFGACHRNEPSGGLNGVLRGRAFVQDDAHVFCSEAQIQDEVLRFCSLLRSIYGKLGFEIAEVGLSLRPELRAGSDEVWDQAEQALAAAAAAAGLSFKVKPGDGAFYGPKLEFALRDARGRLWQCGVIQVDFVLPKRLGASYVGSDGSDQVPVLLHHAILGSMERFIGVLLEHSGGRLPSWLAPEQIVVASIADRHAPGAEAAVSRLIDAGLRAVADVRSERIARKVAEAARLHVPWIAVIGDREQVEGSVSLSRPGGQAERLPLDKVIERLRGEADD
jgi:threonyl-tRNA synthetase